MNFWVPSPLAPILHTVTFSVKQRPRAWSPAAPIFRGGKGSRQFSHMSKPAEDRDWQTYFREEWLRKMSKQGLLALFPWEGPLMAQGFFLYQPPKNWYPGKEKTSTPDDDNLMKQAVDALTPKAKGGYGAWIDDRQIIARSSAKFFHPRGDACVITLYLLENVEKPKRGRSSKTQTG